MGVYYETIPDKLIKWCLEQKMFCVATAPRHGGHVNVSPKGGDGHDSFGIIDEKTFWYRDLSGSGNETLSHLYEPGNGRITIMFCAYEGPPQIVRFWGNGFALEHGTKEFDDFSGKHNVESIPGTRSIIIVDIHQVGSSCGFSVPFYDFKEHRPVLENLWKNREKKFKEGKGESMPSYWAYKNAWSMDGLPGMKRGQLAAKTEKVVPIVKMVGPLAPKNGARYPIYDIHHLLFVAVISFLLGILATNYGTRLGTEIVGELSKSMASPRAS